jgi:uncharacterized membrane protein YfcA
LAVGTFAGARIAHALPHTALRRAVAIVLIVVGAAIAIKVTARLFA